MHIFSEATSFWTVFRSAKLGSILERYKERRKRGESERASERVPCRELPIRAGNSNKECQKYKYSFIICLLIMNYHKQKKGYYMGLRSHLVLLHMWKPICRSWYWQGPEITSKSLIPSQRPWTNGKIWLETLSLWIVRMLTSFVLKASAMMRWSPFMTTRPTCCTSQTGIRPN